MQDETKELAQTGAHLSNLYSISPAIIAENGWQSLIASGRFDENKALLCLEATRGEYLKQLKPATVEDAICIESPALSSLKLYRGEIKLNALIHSILYQIKDFFSVGRQMTDTQIEILCDLIFQDYYWLTVAEFKCFARKCMSAHFGPAYDRMDGDTIMQWLSKFSSEVLETRRIVKYRKEQEAEKQEKAKPLPQEFADKMEALFKKWEDRKNNPVVRMQFTSLEQYCRIAEVDKVKFFEDLESGIDAAYNELKDKYPSLNKDQFAQWTRATTLSSINKKWLEGVEEIIVNAIK